MVGDHICSEFSRLGEDFKEDSEAYFLRVVVNEICSLVFYCSFVLVNFTFYCNVFEFAFISSCLSLPMGSVSIYSANSESKVFRLLGLVGAHL